MSKLDLHRLIIGFILCLVILHFLDYIGLTNLIIKIIIAVFWYRIWDKFFYKHFYKEEDDTK